MASSSCVHEYPFPWALNVANFVSIKLSSSNYKLWETQMVCLIQSQDLFGFIDATIPSPPLENYLLWKRCDLLLKGWILGSLSERVVATVVGFDTAKDVWRKLRTTYHLRSWEYVKTKVEEQVATMAAELDMNKYLPLYKAALRSDWKNAQNFLVENPFANRAQITSDSQTVLHVAVGTVNANNFVNELIVWLTTEAWGVPLPIKELCQQNSDGDTALAFAAIVGNTQAATILVNKCPSLLYISNYNGRLPVHRAAKFAQRETLLYLLIATEDHIDHIPAGESNPLTGQFGVQLLVDVIVSGFVDIALYLVLRYPHLATLQTQYGDSPLTTIARQASVFSSGTRLRFWESFIYFCFPTTLDHYCYNPCMDEDQNGEYNQYLRDRLLKRRENYYSSGERSKQWMHRMLSKGMGLLVSPIMHIRQKKMVHRQALQLVKCLCKEIKYLYPHTFQCRTSILSAAISGIHEVIEEIVNTFPNEIWGQNEDGHSIFQLAIKYRCEKVFNLIYQMSRNKYSFSMFTDTFQRNILHLAGKLAPPHKLNLVSGAALQMQRELQWFKEVEKFVNPSYKEKEDYFKETPAMVFSREHKKLVIEGEKWMKDTATSCTVATALITTMVFAAAITVPGGNNGNTGLPLLSRHIAFRIFSISDAFSLFMSTFSLLTFLSILTARYAEQDFLYALPMRLIIGLATMFLSIISMMVAFTTTIYLLFGQSEAWILGAVVALACPPIISFVFLQCPLLVDVIFSTYGRGIFRKQSNRPFY